jgi:hypothetical protein
VLIGLEQLWEYGEVQYMTGEPHGIRSGVSMIRWGAPGETAVRVHSMLPGVDDLASTAKQRWRKLQLRTDGEGCTERAQALQQS